MTTERFRYDSALEKVYDDNTYNGETTESYGVFECCEIMNEQHETIQVLKVSNGEMEDYLARLEEENEQLKQRNNRQAKQLDRLYNLIEEKDWRTLTDIIDDFKRCEEQLQKEWKCYE